MKASAMKEFKVDTAVLQLQETRTPTLEADEVLIRVRAATISQIELLRCKKGEEALIRECSGRIIKVGRTVTRWRIGDKVCALLNGRQYAEEVVVSSKCVLRAPSNIPLVHAAGLPVEACNTYYAINKCLELRKGDILVTQGLLFHFTFFAIERAKRCGIRVFAVSDCDVDMEWYKKRGIDAYIDSRKGNIAEQIRNMSGMKGANAVLSHGADNIHEYSQCLAKNGVILLVWDGTQRKPHITVSLGHFTSSCARIKICDMYSLVTSLDEKSLESLVREVEQYVWKDLEDGLIRYMVHKTVPASEMSAAVELIDNVVNQKVILVTKELSLASKVLSKACKLLPRYSHGS